MFKAFGQNTHSCPDGSMRGMKTASTPFDRKCPIRSIAEKNSEGAISAAFSLIGRGINDFSVFCSNADHASSG